MYVYIYTHTHHYTYIIPIILFKYSPIFMMMMMMMMSSYSPEYVSGSNVDSFGTEPTRIKEDKTPLVLEPSTMNLGIGKLSGSNFVTHKNSQLLPGAPKCMGQT